MTEPSGIFGGGCHFPACEDLGVVVADVRTDEGTMSLYLCQPHHDEIHAWNRETRVLRGLWQQLDS